MFIKRETMTHRTFGFFKLPAKLGVAAAMMVFAGFLVSCADAGDEAQTKPDEAKSPAAATVSGKTSSATVRITKPPASGDKAVSGDVPEPADYRMNDYRSPVPATLKGARVVEGEDARVMHDKNDAVFIDVYPRAPKPANLPKNTVWRDPPHMSIKGAHWLPNVGYGLLAPQVEAYFRKNLTRLTAGDKTKPVAFFCLKDCWMSWNAAKRAVEWGYTSVIWFADGTDGWQEAGGNLTAITGVKN